MCHLLCVSLCVCAPCVKVYVGAFVLSVRVRTYVLVFVSGCSLASLTLSQNKKFVYKGTEAERLADFIDHIQERFPEADPLSSDPSDAMIRSKSGQCKIPSCAYVCSFMSFLVCIRDVCSFMYLVYAFVARLFICVECVYVCYLLSLQCLHVGSGVLYGFQVYCILYVIFWCVLMPSVLCVLVCSVQGCV